MDEGDEFDEEDEMCAFHFSVSFIICCAKKRYYYQAR